MADLAASDWHATVAIGTEIKVESNRDFVLIVTARPTSICFLILGLLNVAYKLVRPMEVFDHGVFANFVLDNASPFAYLNILPKPGTTGDSAAYEQFALPPLNSSAPVNGTLMNVSDASGSISKPVDSSSANQGYIVDPLDPKFTVAYRLLSAKFEDVDLWTAFLSAMALAAMRDKDASSASISTFPSSPQTAIPFLPLLIFLIKQHPRLVRAAIAKSTSRILVKV